MKLEPEVLKEIEMSSRENAIRIALAQDELPVPGKPYYFDDLWGKNKITGKLSTAWDDYVTEGSNKGSHLSTMDDNLNEMENIDRQKKAGSTSALDDDDDLDETENDKDLKHEGDPDRFGGSFSTFRGDQGGGKYDDDRFRGFTDGEKKKKSSSSSSSSAIHKKTDGIADDYFDAVSGAGSENSKGKGVNDDKQPQELKDNLSDSDARNFCEGWKQEHNVVVGVSWGSLPFDLQQKWLQYACDYLLKNN